MWNSKELGFIDNHIELINSGDLDEIRYELAVNLNLEIEEKTKIISCLNYLVNGVNNFYYINRENGAATLTALVLKLEKSGDIVLTSIVSKTRFPEIKKDPNFKLKIEESLIEKGYPEKVATEISQGAKFRDD